jgi:hypothetical protein
MALKVSTQPLPHIQRITLTRFALRGLIYRNYCIDRSVFLEQAIERRGVLLFPEKEARNVVPLRGRIRSIQTSASGGLGGLN